MSIDTYNENNPIAPWNQIEVNLPEVVDTFENLTEAYQSGYEHTFIDKQKEILQDANDILYCLESVESGLARKVRELIEKLK